MSNQWINTKKRYILYIIICLSYLSNGLDLALVGPSVKDLAALMQTKEANVLYGFTIRSFGNGLGSLIACYFLSKFSRQLQYTASIFIYGLATVLLPYLSNIGQYFFLSFWFGISNAYIDISTNLFVIELFQHHALNFHLQIVHFSLSIGQVAGPLLLGPFLAESRKINQTNNYISNDYLKLNGTEFKSDIAQATAIKVPFTIGGVLFLLCSLAMIICYFIDPYKEPERTVDGKDLDLAKQESKDGNELLIPNQKFYILFVFLVICLNGFELTMEYMFNYFISMYLDNYLGLKGINNTYLLSLLGLAYIIGRGISVLVSALKISVNYMLYCNIIFLTIGSFFLLYINMESSNLYFKISCALFFIGLGYSSCLAGIYVFIEKRINITTTLNSFMICLQTIFFCIESWRLGSKIESNPESFKIMNLYYTFGFGISFILLHLTDAIKQNFLIVKKTK